MVEQVRGLDSLLADYRQLNSAELKVANMKGLRKAAVLIRREVKKRAPYKTGRLKKTGISVRGNRVKQTVTVGISRIGRIQELGTKRQTARPWVGPAVEAVHNQLVPEYAQAIEVYLDRTVGPPSSRSVL